MTPFHFGNASRQISSIPTDVPVYRINDQMFYCDDVLLQEGRVLAWEEEPNLAMIPLNELAIERMRVYLDKLDKFSAEKCANENRTHHSLLKDFEASIAVPTDNKRARLLDATPHEMQKSILGKKTDAKRVKTLDVNPELTLNGF
jgi:hypothetical protein